jgi:glycosyltransferase involved in cell wall biosynthesis
MGERGREAVRERYSWEAIEGHLVDFYAELCKGL